MYTVQGTGGGIFIDETYTINKSIVTQEEQDKILLALQCLSPVDEIHTESILNRLSPPDLITKNTDGSYTLSVCLPIDHWLYGFILSIGTEVEILEPETLKICEN
ncbi:WYL domain-containing protein [Treponema medium]|uniref:WYL domain-containing protein n=1 Tax=Treponema medium TaxID=58231 RepID=UPI00209173BB|nr:WYL domain-containing protein [Treponema medium]